MSVRTLKQAQNAYWNARAPREEQAAYHEILLFGGGDGYASGGRLRAAAVRALRRLAFWIEHA